MRMLEHLDYISVAEIKAKLSENLRRVVKRGRRFAITSHGKPKAVVLSYKDYLGLVDKSDRKLKTFSMKEWQADSKNREVIMKSVSSRFNAEKLSRRNK